jgi:hypothetical protein
MRILTAVVLVLAALWAGWWVVGSRAAGHTAGAALARLRAEGWTAEAGSIAVRGFPNRFDTTFEDLVLAPPGRLPRWRAPFFQILALSYRPWHVIAVFPPAQEIATPGGPVQIDAREMRASLVLEASSRLALDRFTFSAEDVAMTGAPLAGIERALLATRQTAGRAAAHDLALDLQGLRLAPGLRALLDPAGRLEAAVELVSLDATLDFDAQWDRFAAETRPQLTAVELRRAGITWGALRLTAAGALQVGADGRPEGRITVTARGWRQMLALARDAGLLTQAAAETLARGLAELEAGSPDTLAVPLTLAGGRVLFGAIPLGPAPRLR